VLSVAVYNHLQAPEKREGKDDVELGKSNIPDDRANRLGQERLLAETLARLPQTCLLPLPTLPP